MEKKTALQQAVEKIIDKRIAEAVEGNKRGIARILLNMKREFLNELPTERQQLEDAWKDGNIAGMIDYGEVFIKDAFNQYYTTTYKTT